MEHLVFIIWICLFPLTCSIDSFFVAKRKKLNNEKFDNDLHSKISLIQFVIWVIIAYLIY